MASRNRHYENVPFEIPKSWEWTTVKNISISIFYGVSKSAKPKGAYKLLRITDIQDNKVNWDSVPYTDFDIEKAKNYLLQEGDILFARTGATVGKSYLVNSLAEKSIYASYLIRVQVSQEILPQYIKCYFESGYYWEQITDSQVGTGQPNVNGTLLGELKIPIPPFFEQQRIVVEIGKWFNLLEEIEVDRQDLHEIINQTRNKILDLAIHGKLAPQDPSDEPVSELLKRIAPKAILCDTSHYGNVPFEIPMNWVWVKGSDIFNPMKSTKPQGEYFDYIDIDAIDNKQNKITAPKHILSKNAPSRAVREISKGDVLFSMVRPYLKNIAKVEKDGFIASTGFYVCKPNIVLTSDYCFYLMISNYVVDGLNSFMKGDNSPSINNENLLSWLYPIPPIAEQKRITKVIDKVFYLLDKIVAEL